MFDRLAKFLRMMSCSSAIVDGSISRTFECSAASLVRIGITLWKLLDTLRILPKSCSIDMKTTQEVGVLNLISVAEPMMPLECLSLSRRSRLE